MAPLLALPGARARAPPPAPRTLPRRHARPLPRPTVSRARHQGGDGLVGEDGVLGVGGPGQNAPPSPSPPATAAAPASAASVPAPDASPPLSTRDEEDGGDLLEPTSTTANPPGPRADGQGVGDGGGAGGGGPTLPHRTRRTSAAAAFLLHDVGLSRAQVAGVGLQLLRRDVRELRAQARRLEERGVGAAHAPAALAACPALLTAAAGPAAAALLAQAGLRRASTGAALAAFPSLLDAPGAGLAGALGGLLADAVAAAGPGSALAALPPAATLRLAFQRPPPAALRTPAVDVRLHPVAAALIAAGARPADVAALARAAPGLLSSRAGRAALEWLWTRGVPAADAVAAGLALGCAGLCAATTGLLTELEAAGVRAPDGLRLVLARPRLRRGCGGHAGGGQAARRVRAALRALGRAGVPPHAVPGLILAVPEVLERGLGPGPRALAAAGLTPAEVGAVLAAAPRAALAGRGRAAAAAPDPRRVLAQLSALGLAPPAVRAVLLAAPALAVTPPSALRATARALVAAGIPRRALPGALEAAPALLAAGPDGVRAQVAFLAGVGIHSGAAAARWPALLNPALRAQVRFLRARHGLAGARALGRALAAWPHLHGFGEVGGAPPPPPPPAAAAAAPRGAPRGPASPLLPPVPAGLHDLRAFLAALAGGAGPALDALLAGPAPPAAPPAARAATGLALSPAAAAAARPATPAAAADAATAAAAAAAGASPAAVALLAAGVPWRGLVAAAVLAPALLSPALAPRLAGRLAALRDGAGLDGEGLGRLLRWSAAALADAPPGGLAVAAGALARAGVPPALLGRAVLSAPGLLLLGRGGRGGGGGGAAPGPDPAAAVAALAALGLDAPPSSIAAAVSRCPPLLLHSPADLAARGAALRGFGLDAAAAARAAARCPVLLTLPLGRPRYAEVASFLEDRLGLDAATAIAAHPAVLIYSLRNRTGPRAGFLAQRWARAGTGFRPPAVHPSTAPLSAWLAMGDAEFCARVARAPRAEYEAWRAQWKEGQ